MTHINDESHNRNPECPQVGAVNIVEDNMVHRQFSQHGKNAFLFRCDDDSLRDRWAWSVRTPIEPRKSSRRVRRSGMTHGCALAAKAAS